MNINCLSPKKNNNGFSYNVRFRENIKIKKNSKVYLNYASFSRESQVFFKENQTITLTNLEVLPAFKPATPTSPTAPISIIATIPAINPNTGKKGYSFDELQETITTKLGDLTNANILKAYTPFSEDTAFALEESDVGIGYYIEHGKSDVIDIEEFISDTNNERDAGNDADNVYFKSSVNGDKTTPTFSYGYDSYALSEQKFFHPLTLCEEDGNTTSFIICNTNQTPNTQTGGICMGLYSSDYVEASCGSNNANRTGGTGATTGSGLSNPQVVSNNATQTTGNANFLLASPACFLSVEITPKNSAGVNRGRNGNSLIVRVAKRTSANNTSIETYASLNTNITAMKTIASIPMGEIVNSDDSNVSFALQTYYTNKDADIHTTSRKLYFRILNLSKGNIIDNAPILYDSRTGSKPYFFKMDFFKGLAVAGTPTEQAEILNSQIPFNILLSAQSQNEGFASCDFITFDKTQGTDADPVSIVYNYDMSFSEELSKYIGDNSSGSIFPNTCEFGNKDFIYIKNFHLDWFNDAYSILLKNLPIKNYKNTEKESNGGFAKSILATIPSPFSNTVEQISEDKKLITGIFQPSYPVYLELNNQEFETNNFDISIVNANTEEEVKEILKSNISFTILQ